MWKENKIFKKDSLILKKIAVATIIKIIIVIDFYSLNNKIIIYNFYKIERKYFFISFSDIYMMNNLIRQILKE